MKENEKNDPSLCSTAMSSMLRKKRLEKGLSFEALSDLLKLSAERIADLENRADALDLSPFERGHLRNYAAILEVELDRYSSKQLEKTFAELKTIQQKNLNLQAPRNTRWLVTLVVLFALLALLYIFIDLLA
ncbi:helix-turn-helix domain-containing protein [Thiomicrospira sp. R3]|uniref:helix-turn-helix domain-containing protein n=1 Tax=Thiomicrospira sp. R3 TaxID=3035472 RepID=UPI00259B1E1B|nr:helix-turn-helix domain-containing protein [Thiomicrospira sp. R3]WFE69120.1 helix-turn-helix domain-containing protein [Thiomicrospira sp. R3]